MAWLRLIRWKNLLIVFLTQLLVWYCLVFNNSSHKFYEAFDAVDCITNFILLSLSTVMIAAAGYIINDYFDIKIDMINRPGKVVLEKRIDLRQAIIAHSVLNIGALALAGIVALRGRHIQWLLLQGTCTVLLWFYSTHFKKQYITGNVVVALLTALTIVVLMVYKPVLEVHRFVWVPSPIANLTNMQTNTRAPLLMCWGYTFFAFMLTWIREIVKDMEDYKGDAEQGCVTMPIRKGLLFSTRFSLALCLVTIGVLSVLSVYFCKIDDIALSLYMGVFITLPLVVWSWFITKENTMQHYHGASRWLKIIMLTGIGSLIVYHFTTGILS